MYFTETFISACCSKRVRQGAAPPRSRSHFPAELLTRKIKTSRIVSGKMAAPGAGSQSRLVQYVVVRTDLLHELSWPLGAVITQACHAATAAVHLHYGDPDTQRYLAELDSMHKVVLGVSERASVSTSYRDTVHVFLGIPGILRPTNEWVIIVIPSLEEVVMRPGLDVIRIRPKFRCWETAERQQILDCKCEIALKMTQLFLWNHCERLQSIFPINKNVTTKCKQRQSIPVGSSG